MKEAVLFLLLLVAVAHLVEPHEAARKQLTKEVKKAVRGVVVVKEKSKVPAFKTAKTVKEAKPEDVATVEQPEPADSDDCSGVVQSGNTEDGNAADTRITPSYYEYSFSEYRRPYRRLGAWRRARPIQPYLARRLY